MIYSIDLGRVSEFRTNTLIATAKKAGIRLNGMLLSDFWLNYDPEQNRIYSTTSKDGQEISYQNLIDQFTNTTVTN